MNIIGNVICATIRAAGMVAAAPFHAVGAIGSTALGIIFKPVVFGATAGIAIYVAMNPEKSWEIAKGLAKTGVEKTPDALETTWDVACRVYDTSLKYIGAKVLDAPGEPTFVEVATGVAKVTGSLAYSAGKMAATSSFEWVKHQFGY